MFKAVGVDRISDISVGSQNEWKLEEKPVKTYLDFTGILGEVFFLKFYAD